MPKHIKNLDDFIQKYDDLVISKQTFLRLFLQETASEIWFLKWKDVLRFILI